MKYKPQTLHHVLSSTTHGVILTVNALSGTLPLSLQRKYPHAQIICVEYFQYEILQLQKLGFEVIDLHENINNFNEKYIQEELKMPFEMKNVVAVLGNPPYNKLDKEPLYYKFLKQLATFEPIVWSYIIPNGCLIGPKSKDIRRLLFSEMGVYRMDLKGSTIFEGIAQNTVVVYGSKGYRGDIEYRRTQNGDMKSVTFDRADAVLEIPQVYGPTFLKLWNLAKQYPIKFQMLRKIPVNSTALAISDGNGFGGYDETLMDITSAGKKSIMPIYEVTSTKTNYNHHVCLPENIKNAKAWMNDPLFGILFLFVRVTHRTIKTNMGRIPMVIVDGDYSQEKALRKLGADPQLIDDLLQELK